MVTRMVGGVRLAGTGRLDFEWPTWLALIGCYTLWGLVLANHAALGWWFAVPAAIAVAFHSSLQHEVLHGHPTRSAALNEALVFPSLGLAFPYRRFRDLHLRHHNDERLTDPYDDPESFYIAEPDWTLASRAMRWVRLFNGTFAGRMLIGPALAVCGFWWSEAKLALHGDARVRDAWARHLLGSVPVLALVWWSGLELWKYALLAAYPGMSLIMVRSFIEHRAAESALERTGIVDAHWFWRLLFLNNNFHWVHHRYPTVAWYLIPRRWQADRTEILTRNGGYLIPGYAAVAWRWLLRSREPVVHPFLRRDGTPIPGADPMSVPGTPLGVGMPAAVEQAVSGIIGSGGPAGPQQPAA